MTPRKTIISIVAISTLGTFGRVVEADVLQTVAEYMQPAPGTTGNFRSFSVAQNSFSPAISGENIAFGAKTDESAGIYALLDGQLVVIADLDTPMPGTQTTFAFGLFDGSGPSISGRNVVFAAPTLSEGDAIWASFDGVLTKIADRDTPVPGAATTFMSFSTLDGAEPSISGENIAFLGVSDQAVIAGIYLYKNGELQVIADTNTLLPGATQTVTDFGVLRGAGPSISGENIAFYAEWGFDGQGIYAYINGQIQIIADTNTPAPGGGPLGIAALTPSISGENVAFSSGAAIYAYINGSLVLIADTDTTPPGASGPFTNFGGLGRAVPSISGENVAFGAYAPGLTWGIFAQINGSLTVVATTDTPIPDLNGQTFRHFNMLGGSSPAISGNTIVFMGNPAPGIYVRSPAGLPIIPKIPALSTWGLIALGILFTSAAGIFLRRRAGQPGFRDTAHGSC